MNYAFLFKPVLQWTQADVAKAIAFCSHHQFSYTDYLSYRIKIRE